VGFGSRLKHEILEAVPPAIFFFIAFQLIAFTESLMLEEYGVEVSTFVKATVAALIVAKVVLVADLMPFINRFPEKPLIYNVLWKTTIYLIAAVLVRYLEHLFDFWRETGNLAQAHAELMEHVVWPHFWAVQIWLLVLFLMYCSLRELIRALGADRVHGVFFGAGRGSA
jgi:hypothetical protein